VLKINYTYDLPIGHGRALLSNMPRALELILGGWRTSGVWTIADGRPLSFSNLNGGTPLPTYGAQRPDIVGTPKRNYGSDWVDNYFANPNVFQLPPLYALGNAPRALGSVRTPFFFTTNLSMLKEFGLSSKYEAMKLEMRLEAQNTFNHPVFWYAEHHRRRSQLWGDQLHDCRASASSIGVEIQLLVSCPQWRAASVR
jgi:hypothetical protein